MNLSKVYEFFQPEKVDGMVHIVGCGSVGSALAENMVRIGIKRLTLWDFDKVEPHNLTNQLFTYNDVGKEKTTALSEILKAINPDVNLELKGQWDGELLSGYIFLAPDNIEVRQKFVKSNQYNLNIKAVFDVRTTLCGAQIYSAEWADYLDKKRFAQTMNFTHDEAKKETPTSACGVTLGVVTTVRIASALAVNNFIKLIKKQDYWKFIQFDGFLGVFDFF